MNNLRIGELVTSIAGHDKKQTFLVLKSEEDCVFLVDGKSRTVGKPKKKKSKHVETFGIVDKEFVKAVESGELVLDASVRKIIANHQKN